MDRKFDKIYEHYVRIVEDDAPPPPDMGGGDPGAGGAVEPLKPCFTNTEGIAYLVPFIRIYNKAKEEGSLPDRVTKLMIADRSFLRDMSGERAKIKLDKIFRVSGISATDIYRAQKENIKAFKKVKKTNGGECEVRPVGYSEIKRMLDVIGTISDKLRGESMHDLQNGASPITEVEFPNKEDIDYANIWVAYNRIVAEMKGEYRSGV